MNIERLTGYLNRVLLLSALALLVPRLFAFDTQRARDIIRTISADSYQGRRSGHPGGRMAEEFFAGRFSDYGLKPMGTAGYFQDFPLLVTEEIKAQLILQDHELGRIPFLLGVDFTLLYHSGSGAFAAPVVVAGYGYDRADKGRVDYGDLNLSRKIVVIVRGTPDSPYDFGDDHPRSRTLAWAAERGAAAVLWYEDANPKGGAAIPEAGYRPDVPLMYIGDRVMSLLLDGSGYTPETYKEALKSAPLPLETGHSMWIAVSAKKLGTKSARNVAGILYGNDPVLRNEVIVVGGHWDHVGKDAGGIVYNGADDNGSGTAMVSELARTFAAASPPKRSILFLHFGAEEDGLLGSDYFMRHPTVPAGNIVGMVNLDMEGAGNGKVTMGGGDLFGKAWDDYLAGLPDSVRDALTVYRETGSGASDHESFMRAGIPTLAFWARGHHPHYHHYEDDSRWISDSALANVSARAEDWIGFLANYPTTLAFGADSVRLMARLAETVDFDGFFADASGNVPPLFATTAAWLPGDGGLPLADLVARTTQLHYFADQKNLSCDGLKQAIQSNRRQQRGVFVAINEASLSARRPADVGTLLREGLSVIRLNPGRVKGDKPAQSDALETARKEGCYALVPVGFLAPSRVEQWKDHSIVRGTLGDFAGLPDAIRAGLLGSDALVFLDVAETPSVAQFEAIYPARERRVHLNFSSSPQKLRESDLRATIDALFAAGFSRNDVLLLTGGNLRRFLGV